jgi:hypothetical protein
MEFSSVQPNCMADARASAAAALQAREQALGKAVPDSVLAQMDFLVTI